MTATPDPALAALRKYRALSAEWFRLYMESDAAEPMERKSDLAILNARIARAEDAMDAAAKRLTATKPTTAAGAAALIRYVIQEIGDTNDTSTWPVNLLLTAAEALDGIAA